MSVDDDIDAVVIDGRDDGGKIQTRLDDGRVLVGEIRTVDSAGADFPCPVDWCLRRFESAGSCNAHIGFRHPEHASRTECEHCGELFADPPSSEQIHCSWDCKTAANQVSRTCPTCRDTVTSYKSNDNTFCSRACFYESRRDERPTQASSLLRDIRQDGYAAEKLEARAYANLAPEWYRIEVAIAVLIERDGDPQDYQAVMDRIRARDDLDTPDDQRDLLDTVVRVACRLTNDSIDHVGARAVLDVLEDASTMLEVQQAWRTSRSHARQICDRLGIRDAVSTGEGAALKRAKEVLDEGDDAIGGDDDAAWNRHPAETGGGEADD